MGKSIARALAAWVGAFIATAAMAQQQSLGWSQLPGAAVDVGVGANGTAWVIGTNSEVGGYGIYRWNGNNWDKIPGSAVRIDVDPQGNAWVVTSGHAIFRFNGSAFVPVPGAANDVGIGADGSVWVIGNDAQGNDFGIYRYNGSGWAKMPGAAVRIDVDPHGNAWVVNSGHQIFRWTGSTWQQTPGAAVDVGIGSDGSVFVVSPSGNVFKWNGSDWTMGDGLLTNVSVDNFGKPWGVNASRQIWHASMAPATRPPRQYVAAGDYLGVGEILQSPGKTSFAMMQGDGNLCVYAGTPSARGAGLWCHMKTGGGGQFVTVMQGDGNLCTYRGTTASQFTAGATWCSNAVAPGGQFYVAQQDDGNLCVYKGTGPTDNKGGVWCYGSAAKPNMIGPAGGDTILFSNDTDKYLWVTFYSSDLFSYSITGSGCLPPGAATYVPFQNSKVRGELTAFVGCQHPVICDVTYNVTDFELQSMKPYQSLGRYRFQQRNGQCSLGGYQR